MEEKYKNKFLEKLKLCIFFLYVLIFYIYGADEKKVRYSEIILLIFFSLEGLTLIQTKKIKICTPILILFIFSFYCFLSRFWSILTPDLAVNKAITLFLLSFFTLVSYNFFMNLENAEDKLLKVFLYAGVILSFYVIFYYGIDNYLKRLISGERMGEEINNVNMLGLQISISIIIAIFYGLYNNKFYFLLTIVPLLVSLGTGSRKVFILITIGTILIFILKKEEKINIIEILKKLITFTIVVVIFINIAKIPLFSTVFNRLEKSINFFKGQGRVDDSTKIRNAYIVIGIKQFYKKPILGIGINNSAYLTQQVSGENTYLHNNYVELLVTVGIVGFVLYYCVYFYIIFYCIKMIRSNDKYINIVLIIFLINMILEYAIVDYYDKSTYFYILLALVVIQKRKKKYLKNKILNKEWRDEK